MYEQHPIPQQISSYQFRLIGDMTIKEFMQVAGGALVALFIYSTELPPFIKWPLILFSFLTGIALAFFPLEDRPLSKWIILFIKAIYSPTIYVWKKGSAQQTYFQPEPTEEESPQISNIRIPTQGVTPEPITQETHPTSALPETKVQEISESDKLEKVEQEFLTKVDQHFTNPIEFIQKRVQSLDIPLLEQKPEKKLNVPETSYIRIEKSTKENIIPEVPEMQTLTQTGNIPTPLTGQQVVAKEATFSLEATPPNPTTIPNVVVGQVLDREGKIIENAILEIRDSEGRPVRALKTNRLGHFMIATPLSNGRYQIVTEKEGYEFKPFFFEANNAVIPPIAIWAEKPKEAT